MSDRPPVQAVLFDLDGTLLDTAPDMAAALNRLRVEHDLAEMPFESLRPVVSHGSFGLLSRGFGPAIDPDRLAQLTRRFLDLYADNVATETRFFDGMEAVLEHIEASGLRWGIVTNKPGWLTDRVLQGLGIAGRPACVVAGDSLQQRKPHPAPLQHAARLIAIDPALCVYVGDAERDIQAGRAAGMRTLVAEYGYIEAHETPADWQADGRLARPAELHSWLNGAG